jgi:hypothetical protein
MASSELNELAGAIMIAIRGDGPVTRSEILHHGQRVELGWMDEQLVWLDLPDGKTAVVQMIYRVSDLTKLRDALNEFLQSETG